MPELSRPLPALGIDRQRAMYLSIAEPDRQAICVSLSTILMSRHTHTYVNLMHRNIVIFD